MANGISPETGEVLEKGSLTNRAEIVRPDVASLRLFRLNSYKEKLVPIPNVNKIIAVVIGAVAFYSGYVILPELPEAYAGWQLFFDQQNSCYLIFITALYSAAPFGFLSIAVFVFLNKRSYFIFPALLIGWFAFVSYAFYLLLILVLFWWLNQSSSLHLTRHSSKDAR